MEKVGEGREAEVFAWGEGRVLRLLRDPAATGHLEREATALAAAAAAGAPVPAPGELVTVDGRPGLVMERVDGPDALTLLGRRPWTFLATAVQLGELHAALHACPAPRELPELRADLRARIGSSPRVPARVARAALERLDELPAGDCLCHGDLHPGNVIVTAAGPRIIDWTNAVRGDPMADVAWTGLLFRLARPQPSAPFAVRRLDWVGRHAMYRRYLAAYARRRPLDRARVAHWQLVLAAARLTKDIRDERERITAVIEESLRSYGL